MAKKHRLNTALKIAIIESRSRQIVIAGKAGIGNSRLSLIVNGHVEPSADEKKDIAKALRKPVGQLFPESLVTPEERAS